MRFDPAGAAGRARADLVFPATLSGGPMSATLVYRNLRALADKAIDAGALSESDRWIMCSGASGLRRAYVLSELAQGRDPELLTERLGHWRRKSVRKYDPLVRVNRR